MRWTTCWQFATVTMALSAECLAAQAPRLARLAARIDSGARALIASKATPSVAVAISRGGRTVYSKAFGKADLEQNVAAAPTTVYRIGSITKQFTAAAILSLVEDGRISLDDQLSKFFPDWPAAGRGVTVKQLLNHTSGIRDYTVIPRWPRLMALPLPRDSMLALFRDEPMDFAPGTDWRYDNSGYYLLGVIIERVTGEDYAAYLGRRLLRPLGLKATQYCTNSSLIPSRAPGYNVVAGGFTNAAPINVDQAFAAGALCSTADDLLAWTRGLQGGRVITPASYRLMTTPIPLPNGKDQQYGFGLGVGRLAGHRVISHNGGINGFNAQMANYPDDSLIVAVLVNVESREADRFERMVSQWALGVLEEALKNLAVTPDDIARVVGRYVQAETSIEVRFEGGRLVVAGLERPSKLLNQGGGDFRLESSPDLHVRFTGGALRADALVVTTAAGSLTLTRVP